MTTDTAKIRRVSDLRTGDCESISTRVRSQRKWLRICVDGDTRQSVLCERI
ncbi:TPA_asm: hypothetical protein [Porphyromonas phage phage029a_Kyudai3]|uniref:Uncharacterized protein n=1 Tax=Porphyromonas phage phage029a_Kyudai3 TaxID=3154119 RepID=A0AAT9JE51_9CAUD